MTKTSVLGARRDALRADARERQKNNPLLTAATNDSFVNFSHKLGIGADNALTSGTYGYNPITRNRILLEWIHRGSWLGGVAVDSIADDMTRAGVSISCEMEPDDEGRIARAAAAMDFWPRANETIRWGRLYGGAIAVALVDGQDMRTPLRVETVGKGQFRGLLTLDRWMIEPSLNDLVTDLGPSLGLPKFYTVQSNAPALRGAAIHHSRVMFRILGVPLPYQQALTENLWGISVLERLYDRMIAFDSASTGAAQLVFKAHLRTLSINGLRDIVAAGGELLNGLMQYTEVMRRFQGIEGITLLDSEDEFEVQGSGSAITGIDSILEQLAGQLAGALQMPVTRLFGRSPGGLNATGESDTRMYYDRINQDQNKQLLTGVTLSYRMLAQSDGIRVPDDFAVDFRSLMELDDQQKAEAAGKVTDAVTKAVDGGIVGRQTALKELRQSSKVTGLFTNITSQMIAAADDEVLPPMGEEAMAQEHEASMLDKEHGHQAEMTDRGHEHASELADKGAKTALELAKTKTAAAGGSKRRELR